MSCRELRMDKSSSVFLSHNVYYVYFYHCNTSKIQMDSYQKLFTEQLKRL